MAVDQHGNDITVAGDDALTAYDDAVDHLLHFRAEVGDAVGQALAADPSFPMAQALSAYLGVLGTEPTDAARARTALDDYESTVDVGAFQPREQQHLAAAHAWVRGDLTTAGQVLRDLVREHPRDALALAVGHQIDFFTADAVSLRDRVGGALQAWSPDDRHYPTVLGMYAFGLEESGLYARSEQVGLEAVERDPSDVWGIHAVAHTYEMQGQFGDGVRFLDGRPDAWQSGNFLNVHNWWHYCLYLLEAGQPARALEIYDAVLHHAESDGLAMEMLDAAALLWRLHLEGDDQTARWTTLAQAWDATLETPYYSFNDMHAVMSYVGAGRIADGERLIEARAQYVAEAPDPSVTNIGMARDVGLPVARAVLAFGVGDYGRTVELLAPIRYSLQRFGGSHAQRDAVQRTLLEAALRSGRHDLAEVLVSERLGINPCSPYAWLKRAALATSVGDAARAASARNRAAELRTESGVSA